MVPSPFMNMSALAAAATECRIKGTGKMDRKLNLDKDQRCFVRMQGDFIVRYMICPVGRGRVLPLAPIVRQEAPRRFDWTFDLYDPDTFFRSYSACRDAIQQMLMQTPPLCEFDLGADSWDHFMPHELATINVDLFRRDTWRNGGVALRFNLDMNLAITAEIIYDEPKALLLACMHCDGEVAAAVPPTTVPPVECCSVCMEDFAAREDTVSLPCSHAFHRDCISPWFYKAATCPMCRHDISRCLVAVTNTPKGKFPGLGT
ncbi:hypothetical protein ACQ4PT_002615 [Festuca glaucescens]